MCRRRVAVRAQQRAREPAATRQAATATALAPRAASAAAVALAAAAARKTTGGNQQTFSVDGCTGEILRQLGGRQHHVALKIQPKVLMAHRNWLGSSWPGSCGGWLLAAPALPWWRLHPRLRRRRCTQHRRPHVLHRLKRLHRLGLRRRWLLHCGRGLRHRQRVVFRPLRLGRRATAAAAGAANAARGDWPAVAASCSRLCARRQRRPLWRLLRNRRLLYARRARLLPRRVGWGAGWGARQVTREEVREGRLHL